jgi:hypothetical protein
VLSDPLMQAVDAAEGQRPFPASQRVFVPRFICGLRECRDTGGATGEENGQVPSCSPMQAVELRTVLERNCSD